MSIGKKVFIAAVLFSTASHANPYALNDKEYVSYMRDWAKTMVAATVAEQQCGDYGVTWNSKYFDQTIRPIKWNKDDYHQFLQNEQSISAAILRDKHSQFGHKEFCKGMISFFNENYGHLAEKPIAVIKDH